MATKDTLVRAGFWGAQADAMVNTWATGLTAAGTTQATAYVLTEDASVFGTVAASSGALLKPLKGSQTVYNAGANTLTVYPPVGGTINAGSANAGFSVAANKTCTFLSPDGIAFYALLSA